MKKSLALFAAFVSLSMTARADVIFDVSSSLNSGDPTQLGRLSRNAVPQDLLGDEAFPGVINTTTTYHYITYDINPGPYTDLQITIDSLSANTFASAYLNAYLPDSGGSPNFGFNTNWLGDAGSSGDTFGVTPLTFDVIVPVGQELVLVMNNTGNAGLGLGDPFHLTVSSITALTTTPEPATFTLLMSGLALPGLAAGFRKSRR